MEKFRARNFCAVLYPEDPTHYACVQKLIADGYDFAAILHDKDLDEDGNPKKPHWHVVLRFAQARWNEPVAEELGIPVNYLEQCRNLDNALRYLVHEGYSDKYQYNSEDVFGSLATRIAVLLADKDECSRALTIYRMIADSPGIVSYSEIFVKACKAGLYGDFRRMGTGVVALINDHNRELYDETKEYRPGAGAYANAVDRNNFRSYVEGYETGLKDKRG